jgi:recombination protein RecR
VNELILALPPTTEGEFTVHYVMEMLQGGASVTLSRMAMGVPYGSQISFLDAKTLKASLEHRIGVFLPTSPALNVRG